MLKVNSEKTQQWSPLAARIRPSCLTDIFGQEHLLAPGKPLHALIISQKIYSMILWGPPGTGKTTIAEVIAANANAAVEKISAVLAGVKDLRAIVERAQKRLAESQQLTVLFVDEIHRFNKSQQDAFLPHVEEGTLTLIGATTENPSFALNNALLSRTRVFIFKSLTEDALAAVIKRAMKHAFSQPIDFPEELLKKLVQFADGDARQVLNLLDMLIDLSPSIDGKITITEENVQLALSHSLRRFDHGGDIFYDQISALHKAVRGSDPDAALYWLCRMLEGGCDPLYIARRSIRMASEDIGNADPRALTLALSAWEVLERLGSPEGELALAQAIIYLACCAKSNASYIAFKQAMVSAKKHGSLEVPIHLRNAPTKLMQDMGYGKEYRYAHDETNAYAAGENYFPEGMAKETYYSPVERGLEIKIMEKLAKLRQLDINAQEVK